LNKFGQKDGRLRYGQQWQVDVIQVVQCLSSRTQQLK